MRHLTTFITLALACFAMSQGTHTSGFPMNGTPSDWRYAHSSSWQNTGTSTVTYTQYNVTSVGNTIYGDARSGPWDADFICTPFPLVVSIGIDGYSCPVPPGGWMCTWFRDQTRSDVDSLTFPRPALNGLRNHDWSPSQEKQTLVGTQTFVETNPWL